MEIDGEVESEGSPILNLVDSVVERYRTATTAEEKKEAYLLLCNTATRVEDKKRHRNFSSFGTNTSR